MPKSKRFSVFWFDPEPTIGAEIRKVRPCIVVSPDQMNEALRTVLIVPLTSTVKSWPFRTEVTIEGVKSSVACDQIRSIDKSRLKNQLSTLTPSDSHAVLQILQAIFAD